MDTIHVLIAVYTQTPPTIFHYVIAEEPLHVIGTCSNSTVSNLLFQPTTVKLQFNIDGETGTTGSYNITIPSELMSGTFQIYKDDVPLTEGIDYTQTSNSRYIIFSLTYEHSNHIIELFSTTVIPELTALIMLGTLIIATAVVAIYRKKNSKKS